MADARVLVLGAIGSPDMRAMWEFLKDPATRSTSPPLRNAHSAVGWTSFGEWADRTFGAAS